VQARQVVEAIAEAAAWDGEIIEAPALGSPRSQGVSWQRADVSRIGAALGWAPRHGLAEAAASVLADAP
jgi:nucleoside-diphosphate-sugar epimerase